MHWSGDEDGDWNEDTDDVGADGVGPLNEGYTGPDEGEGDGRPTDGEPNFDRTDLDEADQIGLESVSLHQWGTFPLDDDEKIWNFLSAKQFDPVQFFSNIGVLYSSGPFPLAARQKENFSIALLMGANFDDLVRNKNIVQRIFNANYRFAKPPDKPTVKATAGDGFVTLTWDNRAEFSRDPFLGIDKDSLGFKKDFEGYVIYKSTDPGLLDSRLITDAFGNKVFRKPAAQFDVIDGIKGTSVVGLPNGAHFYLGDDTGLAHTWTDRDVINGQIYYYAVVSYDAGDPNIGSDGLPPSLSSSIIEQDEFGNIVTDKNTVRISPGVPAAGFKEARIQKIPEQSSGNGTGRTETAVVFQNEVLPNQQYEISFHDSVLVNSDNFKIATINYSVTNLTSGAVVVNHSPFVSGGDVFPVFDGIGVKIFNDDIAFLPDQSGHAEGSSDYSVSARPDTIAGLWGLYPADFQIVFADGIVATSRGSEIGLPEIPVNFTVTDVTDDQPVDFLFYDYDNDQHVTDGDEIVPLIPDDIAPSSTGYRTTWRIRFTAPSGGGTAPQSGDVYNIRVSKPFRDNDAFQFRTFEAAQVDKQAAKSDLNRIKVVPNPYVVTNPLEPRNLFTSGRGERVIQFIHLPQKCTIRIFTMRGQLIKVIEHNSSIEDGSAKWNLVSRDGIDIAFGVYIFHVQAPGIGEKIGRFAIIK